MIIWHDEAKPPRQPASYWDGFVDGGAVTLAIFLASLAYALWS